MFGPALDDRPDGWPRWNYVRMDHCVCGRCWLAFTLLLAAAPAVADEGMWTFDNFPSVALAQKYGTTIDALWLDRVRLAVVRLSNCTASFVSADGLMLTNHHCAANCLDDYSTKEHSLLETGFLAADRPQEKKCGTQIADTLVAMEDVTAKVAAATTGQDQRTANETRKRTLTNLEQACEQASRRDAKRGPLKCESVDLYQGGQYFLYKYKRYDDVRLVFAPEDAIAAFGGDPDNFQFPRYDLDVAVLRAYKNGRPAQTPNHLQVNFDGPKAGELVFVAGHPGSTDRLMAVAQLKAQRNYALPIRLLRSSELRGRYIQFSASGEQNARITADPLSSLENTIKVLRKQLDALHDDALLARKAEEESRLRARIAANPALLAGPGDPWAEIAAAESAAEGLYLPYTLLEAGAGFNSQLFRFARTLVRGAAERDKPNADRLREYTEAALPRIEQRLGAPVPVYPELERLTLTMALERMREWLGPDAPVVRRLLTTETPAALAARLVAGCTLADPAVRLGLWRGGGKAVQASADTMIELAKSVDAESRAVRKRYEDEVEAPETRGSERIAKARFAAYGTGVYPDATFTLRLNFGTVQGWTENGRPIEPFTRLGTAFSRATGADPFRIPDSWLAVHAKLDLTTPFNFATDNDIVGGNSGSPVIDANGQVVGLVFDGNIHSISGAYWFDTQKNRAVAVHMAIVREALTKVYGATALYRELGGR
jgi:hypothetical protein